LSAVLAWAACSGSPSSPSIADEVTVLIGAGDVGVCGSAGTLATGRLLDGEPGTVVAVGDLA
jgi:hypothetical protein